MNKRLILSTILAGILTLVLISGCASPTATTVVSTTEPPTTVNPTLANPATANPSTTEATSEKKLLVYGVFSTPIETPWDGVINQALIDARDAGEIDYQLVDNAGNSTDYARVLSQIATDKHPDLIVGDSTGQEDEVRAVTAQFPNIYFAMGSNSGPTVPNLSVFDNWVQEPAFLSGMLAAGLTKTNKIGIVAAMPIPEVNRVVNGFIEGVKYQNPDCVVLVSFINSFFDPALAKDDALAQIDAGADVLFAERTGVIEAAAEHNLWVFSNLVDQNSQAPDYVLTGPVWNMTPTIEYLIKEIKAGSYVAQDLQAFSMMAYDGAQLAPFHGLDSKVPADLLAKVLDMKAKIINGTFRVDINEAQPKPVN
jgi:basic membrane lipoprotein Med (substrate-binding protein (PBP1-ABC) superfamily)